MADLEKQKAADVLKAKMHQKSVERAYDNGVKDTAYRIAHLAREIARHCEASPYYTAIRIEKAGAREQTRRHTLTLSQPGPDGRRILAIKNDSSGHTDKYYLSQENVTQLTGIISD